MRHETYQRLCMALRIATIAYAFFSLGIRRTALARSKCHARRLKLGRLFVSTVYNTSSEAKAKIWVLGMMLRKNEWRNWPYLFAKLYHMYDRPAVLDCCTSRTKHFNNKNAGRTEDHALSIGICQKVLFRKHFFGPTSSNAHFLEQTIKWSKPIHILSINASKNRCLPILSWERGAQGF